MALTGVEVEEGRDGWMEGRMERVRSGSLRTYAHGCDGGGGDSVGQRESHPSLVGHETAGRPCQPGPCTILHHYTTAGDQTPLPSSLVSLSPPAFTPDDRTRAPPGTPLHRAPKSANPPIKGERPEQPERRPPCTIGAKTKTKTSFPSSPPPTQQLKTHHLLKVPPPPPYSPPAQSHS